MILTLTLAPAARATEQLLYLASIEDKSITAYHVDAATGGLERKFRVELPGNGGAMAFSPDTSLIYAAVTGLPDGKAGVATLRRGADGGLTLAATATITSRAPYIRADKQGRYLLAAHYGEGDVTVYRIVDGLCTSELLEHRHTEKTAHCVELDPTGKFVFVPHTSPNKVYQFRLDQQTGKLLPNDPPFVSGPDADHRYHEPRHFALHPSLDLAYTSNENGGGISLWRLDRQRGTLELQQTLGTLPPGYEGNSAAADIRLTADGRFAYVSNRDTTQRPDGQPPRDTLAAVALDARTGRMRIVGHYPTVHFPRSCCLDLTGHYLYAAGQQSGNLAAYRIDQQTGQLQRLATYDTGPTPIWVMCGAVEGP